MKQLLVFSRFLLLLICLQAGPLCAIMRYKEPTIDTQETISPIEVLVQGHAIVQRIMLIFEELLKKSEKDDLLVSPLRNTTQLVKIVLVDYLAKLEQEFVLPYFEHTNTQLITILRTQHEKGRKITLRLQELIAGNNTQETKIKREIKGLLRKFITMYRPHIAHVDSLLLPRLRIMLQPHAFKSLSTIFQEIEHAYLGQNSIATQMATLEIIEKELGIYQLEKFTAKI